MAEDGSLSCGVRCSEATFSSSASVQMTYLAVLRYTDNLCCDERIAERDRTSAKISRATDVASPILNGPWERDIRS